MPKVTEATSKPASATLAQQEACARAARLEFRADARAVPEENGYQPTIEYQNHYSAALGWCYMLVTTTYVEIGATKTPYSRTLMNVFEHKTVGECFFDGTSVTLCNMDQPNTGNQTYTSPWDWMDAAKVYLADRQ